MYVYVYIGYIPFNQPVQTSQTKSLANLLFHLKSLANLLFHLKGLANQGHHLDFWFGLDFGVLALP